MTKRLFNSFALLCLGLLFVSCQAGQPARSSGLASIYDARPVINQSTREIVPSQPKNINLFDRYAAKDDALWARGWPRKIDMTGVAFDNVKTCTLISPRHILMAQHYQRKVGDLVVFHDRSGRAIVRLIEAKVALPGGLMPDIAVGILDQETPVRFYRVLPPRDDYGTHLSGALAVITDKDRNLLVRKIAGLNGRHVRFGRATDFAASCADPLITGDSGNPGFVLINGEPILIETHTYGGMGQGPFISNPLNFAEINKAMGELGGGYQLSTLPVGS